MQKQKRFVWVGFGLLAFTNVLAGCGLIGRENPNSNSATSTVNSEMTKIPVNVATPVPVLTSTSISGWVVYSSVTSQEPLETQIFVKSLDTGDTTQLTNSENNDWPRWSPNGSQILFSRWTKENSYDIYLMGKDGSNQRPIVANPASESLAAWSPNEKKIVFVSNKDGNDELYIMELDTQVISKLTETHEFAILPDWSSKGDFIAFESSAGGAGRSQIFTMSTDGSNIQQMTKYDIDNFDGNPVWCPDDTCIIFTRFVSGVPKLMLLDLVSGNVTPLLTGIFDANLPEMRLARSAIRGYITFSVGDLFYAMNMENWEIYPLGVKAFDLSLYP